MMFARFTCPLIEMLVELSNYVDVEPYQMKKWQSTLEQQITQAC
jgi:hypothetical protein